jgi:phosphoribosylformimino-5-aminoimidazole carboxamide ribotide isomerase
MYRRDVLTGGHIIMLGQGNDEAAREALNAWPNGMQVGGGIRTENAARWLEAGASHVIVTSFVFDGDGKFRSDKLRELVKETTPSRLVLDLSCKRTANGWTVAMNRWQTLTDLDVTHAALDDLAASCDEFLIHAVDVEGKCEGIDSELVGHLAAWGKKPMTYAGGARSLDDLRLIDQLSGGKIDVTIGSALDVFGGSGVRYADCVAFNRRA